MPKNARFIKPSVPVLKSAPPCGSGWIYEVKFDGWRAQLHKAGDDVVIFTRNGYDYTARFPVIRDNLRSLPVRSAVIDAEIVVCDSDGKPDFNPLMDGQRETCAPGALTCWS